MRIIGGIARGREISAPKGLDTRPVTDIIRESLFNIWQFQIEGCRFLDLFAGSGCMGLEALSRGASRVVFVDAGAEQVKVIRNNLAKTKLNLQGGEVVKDDVFNVLGRFARTGQTFDLVYLDPPFTKPEMFLPLMDALGKNPLVDAEGTVVIRTEKRMSLPSEVGLLTKVREKKYGISMVHFYELTGAQDADEAPENELEPSPEPAE